MNRPGPSRPGASRLVPAEPAPDTPRRCRWCWPRSRAARRCCPTRATVPKSSGTADEAREAVEAIEPCSTHKSDLIGNGFDPKRNPAVTILTYPEIVQRFSAGTALRPDEYEAGIRSCLAAGKACSGYAIAAKRIKRDRIGNFWLDSFAFRRETNITGWTFNALILFVDDLVVYTVFGGQPNLHELQVTRNPLGPLQGWGEALRPRY